MSQFRRLFARVVRGFLALTIAAQISPAPAADEIPRLTDTGLIPWSVDAFWRFFETHGVRNDDGSYTFGQHEHRSLYEGPDGLWHPSRLSFEKLIVVEPVHEPNRLRFHRVEVHDQHYQDASGMEESCARVFADRLDVRRARLAAIDFWFAAIGGDDCAVHRGADLFAYLESFKIRTGIFGEERSDLYEVFGAVITDALAADIGLPTFLRLERHPFDVVCLVIHHTSDRTFQRKALISFQDLKLRLFLTLGNVPDGYVSLSTGPALPPETTILHAKFRVEDSGFFPRLVAEGAVKDGVTIDLERRFLRGLIEGMLMVVDDADVRARLVETFDDLMKGERKITVAMTPKAALTLGDATAAVEAGLNLPGLMEIFVMSDRAPIGSVP